MLHITTNSIESLLEAGPQKHAAGKLQEAEQCFRQALVLHPRHPQAFHQLGLIALDVNKIDAAIELIGIAASISPNDPEIWCALGMALGRAGRAMEAIAAFRKAIELNPRHLDATANLGVQLQGLGAFEQAVEAYRRAIEIRPDALVPLNNLGVTLLNLGRTDEAIIAQQRMIAFYPNFAAGHANLGTVLLECGRMDEALASLRRALEFDPDLVPATSAMLITLQYHPDYDARAIYLESRRWNDTLVKRLVQPITSHANDPTPGRRLRIGYVSADFKDHSVGRFMLPLLANQDRTNFEVYCYSLVHAPDQMTRRLGAHMDVLRTVSALSDDDLANLIQSDRIDILVDLAMHTHGGRMLLFARKPAPVQVTYLAYAGTTGLTTIDYRLSDPYLDPPDSEKTVEACYSEKTVCLPQTYWCFQAPPETPPVADLPARKNGYITFGCLNNYAKINGAVLETWGRILAADNGHGKESRLILFCPPGEHRDRVLKVLRAHGAASNAIEFVTRGPFIKYLELHHRIDIALDPFPYCGGTTTCDALWMGVPVITLRGNKPVGRAGASILSNAGLPELIAETKQDYIRIATTLAADLARLAEIRRTLRQRLESSPLMNAPVFTRHLEAAFRQMWRTWCSSAHARSIAP